MTEHAELPIEGYKAMADDTEREQEAREWCNAYFGRAECAKVERRVREYHKNPQSFVPLKDIR